MAKSKIQPAPVNAGAFYFQTQEHAMNIVRDVTDPQGNPLIVPTRPDQCVDYSCVDTDVYVPLYRPDINRDRDVHRDNAAAAYRNSCLRFDLFNAISKIDPQRTAYGFALNREFYARFRESEEWSDIRTACNADPLACYQAADDLVRRLWESLEQPAKSAAAAADAAQNAAQAAQSELEQAEQDPDAEPSAVAKLRAEVQVLQAEAEAAAEALESALNQMQQSDRIADAIAAAATDIQGTRELAEAVAAMAGNHAAEHHAAPIDPATLAAANRLRRDQSFRRIVAMVGRVRNDLYHALTAKHRSSSGTTVEVETGNDLPRLLAEDLAGLIDPAMAAFTEYNFMREACGQLSVEADAQAHDGDAIVLVDASGSMSGRPLESAKAFAIALALTLARARRSCHVAFFDTRVLEHHARTFKPSDFSGQAETVQAITHLAAISVGGGTDINAALEYAGRVAGSLALNKPDVVVISDGYDPMSGSAREHFNRFRTATGARLLSIFVGLSASSAASSPLGQLSDKLWAEGDIMQNLTEVGEAIA